MCTGDPSSNGTAPAAASSKEIQDGNTLHANPTSSQIRTTIQLETAEGAEDALVLINQPPTVEDKILRIPDLINGEGD